MHINPPAFFQDRPPSLTERDGLADLVSQHADEDVEEITFLLCQLSTTERATLLFDEPALVSKIRSAQRVIEIQGPPPLIDPLAEARLHSSPPPCVFALVAYMITYVFSVHSQSPQVKTQLRLSRCKAVKQAWLSWLPLRTTFMTVLSKSAIYQSMFAR